MISRLLLFFLVAVQFDGVATVLRFQVPEALAPVFALWKEGTLVVLVTLSLMATLRQGQVRLAVPRALIATWLLVIGMGCIEWLVCRARGTAEPWQSLIALRRVYLPAMMFGIIVMPSWPLPPRWEMRVLHSLGLVTMIVVAAAWFQSILRRGKCTLGLSGPQMKARLPFARSNMCSGRLGHSGRRSCMVISAP